jgi:phosphatidylglycerophosphate synthase
LTPNQYTYLSGVFALVGLWFMFKTDLVWAIIFFLIAAGLDFVDGAVARAKNMSSKVGAYLDTVFDRYVEGIIFFGMFFLSLPVVFIPGQAWVYLAIFGSVVTTYVKAAAKEKDLVNQELKGGLLSRGERLILIFIALVLGVMYPDYLYMTYVVAIIAVLANFTAIQRFQSAIAINKQ